MDIKLPHSLLKEFLETDEAPETIADDLSLCGPTVDRLHYLNNDTIYDLEVITNRVDSASAFGVAREAAAIMPHFKHQAKLINNPYKNKAGDLGSVPNNPPVQVQIMDSALVPRFTAIALSDVAIKDSPKRVGEWLTNSGERPLNNIIDISNELTLKYGQPVHIFDLDKIAGQKMIIRESRSGEKLTTLDGRTHTLKGGDIVIEDGAGNLIDLCGIMGGQLSAVNESTKNILLFVQTYEPKRIRKTSLYTQERTKAAQIFEKSPDPELVLPVLIEGVKLLQERVSAKITSNLLDIYPNPPQPKIVILDHDWLDKFIGIKIPKNQIIKILTDLGFGISGNKKLSVTVPSWRLNDISIKEDLAEEITRIYGYFRLPSLLPPTTTGNSITAPILQHEYQARSYLSNLGFTEIYNLSLVSQELFSKNNISLDDKLKLNNPLSNEYEFLRTSLMPSLLANFDHNRGKAELPLHLFELANTYHGTKQVLPEEVSTLTFATLGVDFLTTKGYLEALARKLKFPLHFKTTTPPKPFLESQTAAVYSNNELLGFIGVIDPAVSSQFPLKKTVVIADLNFAKLSGQIDEIHHFTPVPQYASIFEDITLTSTKPIGDIIETLKTQKIVINVTYLSSHQDKHTFSLEFNDPKGNLTQEKVNELKTSLLVR